MADIPNAGGSTINVGTADTGVPSTLALITIARRAMRILGTQSAKDVEQAALESIQNCVDDINIRNVFDWTIAKDTDVTLVLDQREYDIPDNAFGLKELVLVRSGETPEEIYPLGYLDWDQLQRMFHQKENGFPRYWSARDVFLDRKVELANPPDQATIDKGWKLRIYYRTAIVRPPVNDPTIAIDAPTVVSLVIQKYVQYQLLLLYGEPNDSRRRDVYREYRDLLTTLKGMENRSRPGNDQFRMPGVQMGRTGYDSRRSWPGPHGR